MAEGNVAEADGPATRPEFLAKMLEDEEQALTDLKRFKEVAVDKILAFQAKFREVPGEFWDMFRQYGEMIELRGEYIGQLQENCTRENIVGPLGGWTGHVPKLLHVYALAFYHFYLHVDRLRDMITAGDHDFVVTVAQVERGLGHRLIEVLKSQIKYPKHLLATFRRLDELTEHAKPNAQGVIQKKVDEVKTGNLIDFCSVVWEKCKSAKADGIPAQMVGGGMNLTFKRRGRVGAYGCCVAVTSKRKDNTTEQFQGKIISKISPNSLRHAEQIGEEIEANRRMRHQNVLPLLKCVEDEVFWYLIWPETDGSLHGLLRSGKLIEEAARPLFRELLLGVRHAHSNGIVHGRISPEVIQFRKDHVTICDFSWCTLARSGDLRPAKVASGRYVAPEARDGKPHDGQLADLWTCGVILYEMLCGVHPLLWEGADGTAGERKGGLVFPKALSGQVIDLMQHTLNAIPRERFSAEQVLAHAWMKKRTEVPIASILHQDEAVEAERKSRRRSSRS